MWLALTMLQTSPSKSEIWDKVKLHELWQSLHKLSSIRHSLIDNRVEKVSEELQILTELNLTVTVGIKGPYELVDLFLLRTEIHTFFFKHHLSEIFFVDNTVAVDINLIERLAGLLECICTCLSNRVVWGDRLHVRFCFWLSLRFFFWLSLRLFCSFDRSKSIIDAVLDLARIHCHLVREPCDPVHAYIVRDHRAIVVQKSIELHLADGLIRVTVLP